MLKFDHPSLPEIVALQQRGQWGAALDRLTTIRKEGLCLLAEVNRAICLFHTDRFEAAARLASGLVRLFPPELDDYDADRLMSALLVLAMLASHRIRDNVAACRAGLEIRDDFDHRPGDLPHLPLAVAFSSARGLTIQESEDTHLVIYALFGLQFERSIGQEERQKLSGLLDEYMRVEASGRAAQEIFERVLMRPGKPVPHIDFEAPDSPSTHRDGPKD